MIKKSVPVIAALLLCVGLPISYGADAIKVCILPCAVNSQENLDYLGRALPDMVATRLDKQISVDAVSRFLSDRSKAALRVVTDLFTAGVSLVVAWNAWRLLQDDRAAGTTLFASVPMWVCELILPVAFAVIAVRYLAYAALHLRAALAGRSAE